MAIKFALAVAALLSLACFPSAQASSLTARADTGSESYPPSLENIAVWSDPSVPVNRRTVEKATSPVRPQSSPATITPSGAEPFVARRG